MAISDTVRPGSPATAAVRVASLPLLEQGDVLTREEFERRYWRMTDAKQAELIEGVVYMPAPVSFEKHALPHGTLVTWLGVYAAHTPPVRMGDNASVRLDADNEFQPDALLRLEPPAGGRSRVAEDGIIEGAPELVAEVAASSVSRDLHTKMRVYRRAGVREYLVWRVDDGAIDWFALGPGDTRSLAPDDAGLVCSEVFAGLCLDTAALLGGDVAAILAALQRSVQSDEHAAFVARLAPPAEPSAEPSSQAAADA